MNAAAFRADPDQRRAYLALQQIIKNPLSLLVPLLWAEIQSCSKPVDWDKFEADLINPLPDDDYCSDSPLDDLLWDDESHHHDGDDDQCFGEQLMPDFAIADIPLWIARPLVAALGRWIAFSALSTKRTFGSNLVVWPYAVALCTRSLGDMVCLNLTRTRA